MKKIILFVFVCVYFVGNAYSQIKINEIQSSNSKTIKDPNYQEYVDWIELYNTTTSSVNVGGFYLTDNKDEPRKWAIPTGTTIAAKGYLLIWADGLYLNLHTNYKLTTDGETLLLYSSAMLLHDSVTFPQLEADFSYGRTVNGAGVFDRLSIPTPGTSNVSTVVKGIAPQPTYSVPAGFYTANQTVTISSTIAGAVIRYTTDGSEPTATSTVYTGPITAQKTTKTTLKNGNARADKTGIQKYAWAVSLTYPTDRYVGTRDFGFVIKAKVFHNDYLPSYTSTSTYFINMRKPTLPVVSMSTAYNNFFDPTTGIYIQGTNGKTEVLGGQNLTANWYQDWERDVHIEYFDANGVKQFGINAGVQTMGAVSRNVDMKSLVVAMKSKYEQGIMNYPVFGTDGLNKYSSFLLRNSGNDWEMGNMARDAIIQSVVRNQVDLETQDYQPVVMFLNGEYWGLINMRERYDGDYFAGYHSYANADNIDLLKLETPTRFIASEGDTLRLKEMLAYLKVNSMATQANYDYVKSHYIDVDNMINYFIAQLYCQNTDWPDNNARMWRPRDDNGKFRFPLYDTDFGYGLWGDNDPQSFTHMLSSSCILTDLYKYMILSPEFKADFIQRYLYMLNTTYSVARLTTIANNIENNIKTERDTYTNAEWTRTSNSGYSTASMISWGTSRISSVRGYIDSQFGNKGFSTLTVNYTASQGTVSLSDLPVTPGYSGQQYNSTQIRLTAVPADGYQFVGWVVGATTVSTSQEYFLTITAATTISASFQARPTVTNLKINEIMASNSTIIANELGKNEDWIEIYNAGTSAVDIAGLYITDNSLLPTKHKIPYGSPTLTTIPAGGYLLLWADDEAQEGALHLPFKLNKDGDTLILSQKSSTGTISEIENIIYFGQNTDISYGRYPDGNANKIIFTVPTPNATNTVQSATFVDGLKITEFMAKNGSTVKEETGSYADWIEIYNTNSTAVDLGGLFITNDLTNPNMYMIPKGQSTKTTVAANSYFILWADKQSVINPNHIEFKLNAIKGDVAIVQLRGSTNYIIDQVSYTNQGEDIAYGRYPSTTSSFIYLPTPTPGTANVNSTVIATKTGITINEALAWNTSSVQDETGGYADFMEFYNSSTTAIDLGGLFVSDSLGYSLRYRIPRDNSSATTVQPGQWITFWADGKPSQGTLHLDFSLDQLGEDLVLSQVTDAGIQQLDLKSFTSQTANVSYGRFPENSTNWELMAPTYNAINVSIASSTALKTLTSSIGTISPTVSSTIFEYVCSLPSGTTTIPTISATAINASASVTITQATSLSGTAKISVISANGNYTQLYTVSFSTAPSTDATLKTLTLASGTLSPTFSAATNTYTATITSSIVPLLTAVPNQKNALVEIAYAATTSNNTVITVTAESGVKNIYTISYTITPTTVTTWTENFTDNILTGWGVNYSEYTLTETNQELTSHLTRGDYTTNGYKYFYYEIPTEFLINVSANPKVIVSAKASQGLVLRIDMVDVNGRITNTNAVTKTITTSYVTYTFDFTGKFTDTYGTNPGTVDNTKIVGLYLMIDPGEAAARDKILYLDNLVIGATPSNVATLATLTATDGTLSPTFASATTNYTLTLPAGTTTIPTISATKSNAYATLEISQASTVDGTATVKVIAQDNSTIKTYTVDLIVTPTTVLGYTDYIVQPSMQGWTDNTSTYALTYLGGAMQVDYTRTATSANDAITYNITDAAAKILNLASYPYVAVRLKTTVAANLRVDLFDGSGYVTNATPVIKPVTGTSYVDYIFDFTGKFSQISPTQTVASGTIRGIKMILDAGSTTPSTGVVTIEKLIFGNEVVIPTNVAPVIATIPGQSIMQTQTFNNILLNNFVTDDSTPIASLVWSTNTPTNLNVSITNNVATVTPKNTTWIGSETVTFTVQDAGGLTSTKTVTFTVTELKIPVESISFSQSSVSLAQAASTDLTSLLVINPVTATVLSTTWAESSANASITSAGVITNALAWGTETVVVTVTVTDKNSNVYTQTINVVLTGCPTQLTSVSLSPATVSVTELQTVQLTPVYVPTNACLKTVTYTSSDLTIATVSSTGLVSALIPGTTTITISVNDGFTTKTATRIVTVTKDCSGSIVLALSESTKEIIEGNTGTLTASFTPNDECTSSKIVTWTSSNTGVATVSNGVVTALTQGTAIITASTDGTGTTSATCTITVLRNCNAGTVTLSVLPTTANLYTTETVSITPTVLPTNACDLSVTWISSNPSVATVADGVVTAVAIGTATITCTSVQSPAVSANTTINVLERFPSSITMSTSATIYVGDNQTLTPIVLPTNADNKSVTWVSSNTNIATVSNGVVTAIAQGTAIITATTVNGISAQCNVSVIPVLATSVTIPISLSMTVYDVQTLTASIVPTNTTDKTIVWTTTNNQIATVVEGIVTAEKAGTCIIRATAASGVYAECSVTVGDLMPTSITASVTGILPLLIGATQQVNVTFNPTNVTNTNLTWSSSDMSVATVNSSGLVTAVSVGSTTITITTANGKTTSFIVEVSPILASLIELNLTNATIKVGETQQLIASILPINTTNQTVIWSSDATSTATVNNTGLVTAVAEGLATITATTSNGLSVTCIITVELLTIPVAEVQLNKLATTLQLSQTETLTATVLPIDATNKSIVWASSNVAIATVSQLGVITPVAVGQVTITATASNGISDACVVDITYNPATSISFNPTSYSITQNATVDLNTFLVITPSNASIQSITWSETSSNATVSAAGIYTNTLAFGTESVGVTCTVTDKLGNVFTDYFTVNATGCPTQLVSVSLSVPSSLVENSSMQLTPTLNPANACVQSILYTSSNTAVATVSQTGLLTAINVGTAEICIAIQDGFATRTACYSITVTKDCSGPIVIALNNSSLNIIETNTATLSVSFTPNDECTSSKIVAWASSNSSIATVSNGVVTAVAVGTAIITASTDGTGTTTATCTITVLKNCDAGTLTVSVDKPTINIYIGDNSTITPTVLPANACDLSVTWVSSNTNIATVTNGVVTAIAIGSATIYCTTVQSPSVVTTSTINVLERMPNNISMATTATMFVEDNYTLTPTILPVNADNKTLTWTSSNTNIATVSNGVITAIAPGVVTITATTVNALTAQCIVTVNPILATSVTVNPTQITLLVYGSQSITPTVLPSNTTDKSIVWSTSDNTIATVSNGVVTAVKAGTAIIRATTTSGKYAETTITVNDIMPSDVTITVSSATMNVATVQTVLVSFSPSNVTNTSLTWASNNTGVATVNSLGQITAVAPGSATISVTTANGITKTFVITVNPILASSVSLNISTITLRVSENQQLIATVLPESTTNKTVTWTSNNGNIATVDNTGKITANSVGEAIITATTNNGKIAQCVVTVQLFTVDVSSISLDQNACSLLINETKQLLATILPETATNKSVIWSVENNAISIASVDQTGLVTAKSVGTVRIIAKASNGLADTCEVTVNPILATSITMDFVQIRLGVGETASASATILPITTTNKTITWSVANSNIANVASNGTVTGVSAGTTTLYAQTSNGYIASCQIIVDAIIIPVESLSVQYSSIYLDIDHSYFINVSFTPADATNTSLTWSIADPSIATVNTFGTVTGISAGTTTVTATSNNGKQVSASITVLPMMASDVIIDPANLSLALGNSSQIQVTVLPVKTTDKSITWSSSNSDIVTVSNGIVTGIGIGTAIITATTNNNVTAECIVTVNPILATSVELSIETGNLMVSETYQLSAVLMPTNITNPEISWSSVDETIATVDANGLVTAVGVGVVQIIATVNGIQDVVIFTVEMYNEAPVVSLIPEQKIIHGLTFGTIDLNNYFVDDNTSASNLLWAANASGNIMMNIDSKGIATIFILDPQWVGSEVVTVYATDEQGLQSSADITFTIENDDAIKNVSYDVKTNVYPNPSNGRFTIDLETILPSLYHVQISNSVGNTLFTETVFVNGKTAKNYDLSAAPRGTYFIVISNKIERKTLQVILK